MIKVSTIHGEEIYLNPDHIEMIKSTPDTIIVMKNEKRVLVTETPDQIIDRIVEYRQRVFRGVLDPKLLHADNI